MWYCTCKTANNSITPFCSKCQNPMPQSERNRIYKDRLQNARKALGIDYIGSIEKTARTYLGDDTISIDKLSGAIFQILNIIRKWFIKHKEKLIIFAIFIAFFSSARGIFSHESKQIRSQAKAINKINRSYLTHNMASKIKSIPLKVEFYFENPANSINEESRQRIDEKINIVKDNLKDAKQIATEFVINSIKEMAK